MADYKGAVSLGHCAHVLLSNILYPNNALSSRTRRECAAVITVLGHIYNCSSLAHFYCASKHTVTALTEGVRQELRELKSHIRVTSISPGLVKTEFAYRIFENDPSVADNLYSSIHCLGGEDIVNAVVYALGAPPHVQVHEVIVRPTEQTN